MALTSVLPQIVKEIEVPVRVIADAAEARHDHEAEVGALISTKTN
jgi:hypothetical protein